MYVTGICFFVARMHNAQCTMDKASTCPDHARVKFPERKADRESLRTHSLSRQSQKISSYYVLIRYSFTVTRAYATRISVMNREWLAPRYPSPGLGLRSMICGHGLVCISSYTELWSEMRQKGERIGRADCECSHIWSTSWC